MNSDVWVEDAVFECFVEKCDAEHGRVENRSYDFDINEHHNYYYYYDATTDQVSD